MHMLPVTTIYSAFGLTATILMMDWCGVIHSKVQQTSAGQTSRSLGSIFTDIYKCLMLWTDLW